ncbi:MAG: tail fiber domain-containing protein [Chthoniobacterales bacterium]
MRNTASGMHATIPGGVNSKATNRGSFVWSGEEGVETVSTNNYSFTVRARGGARFITTTNTDFSDTNIVNGVQLLPNETAWTVLSDRATKTNFAAIDKREVLAKLASLPVSSWSYKHDPARRYIGPTAQDFLGAFHLGHNDKGINTLDADGVAFAAIQGLVEELQARDARIERLENELKEIRQQLGNFPPAP